MKLNPMLRACHLLAIAAVLSPAAAQASNWVPAASSDAASVSVDVDSIRTTNWKGKVYKSVWEKWEFKQELDDETKAQSVLDYIDCDNREFGSRQITSYRSDGSVIDTFNYDDIDFTAAAPDTMGDMIITLVCKQ